MEFAGFHIININTNPLVGSKQNAEIYYESDVPFPFSYASHMIREQNLDTLQGVQDQDPRWININKTRISVR
jgi:hypothetical protein